MDMGQREREYIEGLKLSVRCYEYKNFSVRRVLEKSIDILLNFYKDTKEEIYLKKAKLHIICLLEMGFEYKGNIAIKEVLNETEIKVICKLQKNNTKKYKPTRGRIRSMIGVWNPKYHTMPINNVVDDIISKVTNNERGIYRYSSKQRYKDIYDVYELVINDQGSFLCYLNKNIYYEFEV